MLVVARNPEGIIPQLCGFAFDELSVLVIFRSGQFNKP